MGKKFGFVKYDRYGAAILAVKKMNGVWIENEKLFVKEATFGQNDGPRNRKPPSIPVPTARGKGIVKEQKPIEIRQKFFGMGSFYAQALLGKSSKGGGEHSTNFFIKPMGNGWLHKSVVATMNKMVPMVSLQVNLV